MSESERLYTMRTGAGELRQNLTRAEAIGLARQRSAEWRALRRAVVITVTYRDGSIIPWEPEPEPEGASR